MHIKRKIKLTFAALIMFLMTCWSTILGAAEDQPLDYQTEGYVLEEVIVTAQKRSQSLLDVPLAVTVTSVDKLRETGMLAIPQLTDLHPSVSFDTGQSFQNSSLKIRGIGTVGNGRTFEGSVGVFVDGVYRSRSGMALLDMLDIERLEVMRGSQGTLFGKNTVAGAIALSSNRPDFNERSGQLELRLGEYSSQYLAGNVNLPINDEMALRFAGSWHTRDGYFESPDNGDEYDEVDRFALKAQALFTLADDLEILLIADVAKSDAHCCWGSAQVFNGPITPVIATYSMLNGYSFVLAPDAERDRVTTLNTHPEEEVDDYGIAMHVNWNFGDLTLKSISSFRSWQHEQINTDPDFVPVDILQLNEPAEIDSFSQEFNLSIPVGNTDLLLGLYYAQEDYDSVQTVTAGTDADNYLNVLISSQFGAVACLPPLVAADCLFPPGVGALLPDGDYSKEVYQQDTDTFALFAHAVTNLTDSVDLVTGLRWSVEEKDGSVDNLFWYDSPIARAVLETFGVPDDGTPRNGFDIIGANYSPSFSDDTRDNELTGNLTLQFYPRDQLMLYAGYHRGYKAGGVNLFREAASTNTQTYAPETADSIEAGLKLEHWDNRARTNIAIFHTEFSDLQINFFDGLNFRTENTGEASTQGLELETQVQATERLRVDFAATYLDAKFDRIDNPFLSYLVGRDTPRAPEWASVLGLSYDRPLSNSLRFRASGLASYTGSHFTGADVATEEKVGSYVVADASIGLRNDNSGWEVTLWCRNCGDEDYRTIYFNSTAQPGSFSAYLNAPKQYGVTFRKDF